jgi:prepilin-type N-terminal cleavage/methylation domain-containing protein
MKSRRAFTIAEVLTVLVIVGLILAAVAMSTPMILRGQSEVQLQVDNIQSAALALYRVQRDVRQSDTKGILSCSTAPVVLCAQPLTASPAPVQALAIVTADSGTGQFQPNTSTGSPKWEGFYFYWLAPNAEGTSNDLKRAYASVPLPFDVENDQLSTILTVAQTALAAAVAPGKVETVAQNIVSVQASVDPSTSIVSLRLDSGNTSGNLSSMTLWGDSYVRN